MQGYNKYKKCWRWVAATTSVTETTTRAGEAWVAATSAGDSIVVVASAEN